MKAILINASIETVELIDLKDGGLQSIYEAIGFNCSCIAMPTYCTPNNVLFVDDESLFFDTHGLDENGYFGFVYDASNNAGRFEQGFPIIGNGLILGQNDEGDSCDVTMNLDIVRKRVHFMTRKQAKDYKHNPPRPQIRPFDGF